jgi:excisionase family DNA binding protein
MNTIPDKLLTAEELARRLNVGQDKVRGLARTGHIPSVQVGKHGLRFDWHDVLETLRVAGAAVNRQEQAS